MFFPPWRPFLVWRRRWLANYLGSYEAWFGRRFWIDTSLPIEFYCCTVITVTQFNNGYNGGWPSARLFGWSAADWSRPATNKSISSERKSCSAEKRNHEQVGCWLVAAKRVGLLKRSSKKVVNRKETCFISSQTRWPWQNKRACHSCWTCSSSPGHWSHTVR